MMNSVHNGELVARRHARQVFVAAATALAVLFMGNNLPSALYGVFRPRLDIHR